MLYRVTIDFAVETLAQLATFRTQAEALFPIAKPINPGQDYMEPAFIRVQRCYHDEHPGKPCETIYYRQKPPLP